MGSLLRRTKACSISTTRGAATSEPSIFCRTAYSPSKPTAFLLIYAGRNPAIPTAMKVDVAGNVYCGGAGGLWIMDPNGKKLGRIVHGAPATTNLAFGGSDWKTLYFTSRNHLGAVNVKLPGIPVPVGKK